MRARLRIQRARVVTLGALALAVSSLLLFVARVWDDDLQPIDDAFTYVRYADNLLAGYGFTWNRGQPPVHGCTSVPYTFLVAGARAVLGPRVEAATLLRLMSTACGLLAIGALCLAVLRSLVRDVWPPVVAGAVVAALLCLDPLLWIHASSGMETMLALASTAALIATVEWTARAAGTARLALLAAVSYLAYAIRPDSGPYALGFPALYLGLVRPRTGRSVLLFTAVFSAALAADVALRIHVFGDPLPLPVYAKRPGFFQGYVGAVEWNPVDLMALFALMASPWIAALLLTAGRAHARLLVSHLLPVAAVFGVLGCLTQIMGGAARFYVPALPFLVVPAAVCLEDAQRAVRSSPGRGLRWRLGALALTALVAAGVLRPVRTAVEGHIEQPRLSPSCRDAAVRGPLPDLTWAEATWAVMDLCDGVPDGTSIAASEYGRLAATHPELTVIDLVGLHDPVIAHEGFSADRLMARRPQLIWFPHHHYTGIRRDIVAHPRFAAEYLYAPCAYGYGLAVRADEEALTDLVRRHLSRTYPGVDPDLLLGRPGP